MRSVARVVPVDVTDPGAMIRLAADEAVDLTVVGPEAILDRGVADVFRAQGCPVLGPSRQAAQLECSKVFAKTFMARHAIPTARFRVCDSAASARAAVSGREFGYPVVVKADGLAAGKGVVVAATPEEAEGAIAAAMVDHQFGAAGERLIVEECLTGPEVSFFALCDGQTAIPLGTAQDHKRIWDDDLGPNTGGMGAFAPSPLMNAPMSKLVMEQIVEPVLDGMRRDGHPFVGFLYAGLMLTPEGPKVIEFNVRFGDPEAQVLLPQLTGPFAATLLAAATGQLKPGSLGTAPDRFVGVVIASKGYPSRSDAGRPIDGLSRAAAVPGALVFHAGTAEVDRQIVTAGGRVLTIVGRGATFQRAMDTAYRAVDVIQFDGMQFRRDIGRKAVAADPEVQA